MKEIKDVFEAEEEFLEAVLYYGEKQAGLGLDFASEVSRSFELISNSPLLWGKRYKNYRRYILKRFPFEICMKIAMNLSEFLQYLTKKGDLIIGRKEAKKVKTKDEYVC